MLSQYYIFIGKFQIKKFLAIIYVLIVNNKALGKRLPWNDPNILLLKEQFDDSQEAQISFDGIFLDIFPWLLKLGYPKKICNDLLKRLSANKWFQNEIEEQLVRILPFSFFN